MKPTQSKLSSLKDKQGTVYWTLMQSLVDALCLKMDSDVYMRVNMRVWVSVGGEKEKKG